MAQPASPSPLDLVALRPASPADASILKSWREEASVGLHQPLGELTTAQLRAELAAHRPEALYRGNGDKDLVTLEIRKLERNVEIDAAEFSVSEQKRKGAIDMTSNALQGRRLEDEARRSASSDAAKAIKKQLLDALD